MDVKFYLGTHEPSWLGYLGVPLFVSHRRLMRQKKYPRATTSWCLDSGGFSELSLYGEWRTSAIDYVKATRRYQAEIGNLEWAAIQDYMCEPFMIGKTGLSITEHIQRTIQSWVELTQMAPELPWMPVLQGYSVGDYLACLEGYRAQGYMGIKFGIGSVCRRQDTNEIDEVFRRLSQEGLSMHGFGVKTLGLRRYGQYLESSDSMAWSMDARRLGYSWCGQTHMNCANCAEYALMWRERIVK